MTQEKRTKLKDQTRTAERICEGNNISEKELNVILALYQKNVAAYDRCNGVYKVKGTLFLLGDSPKSAATHGYLHEPKLVEQVRYFEENGIEYELDRIDNNGHYAWDNIQLLTKAKHKEKTSIERSIPVFILGVDNKGGLRPFASNNKTKAKKGLGVSDATLNKIIEGYCEHKINDDTITFLRLEQIPFDEQQAKKVEEMRELFNSPEVKGMQLRAKEFFGNK